jgi:hypothetical protein
VLSSVALHFIPFYFVPDHFVPVISSSHTFRPRSFRPLSFRPLVISFPKAESTEVHASLKYKIPYTHSPEVIAGFLLYDK